LHNECLIYAESFGIENDGYLWYHPVNGAAVLAEKRRSPSLRIKVILTLGVTLAILIALIIVALRLLAPGILRSPEMNGEVLVRLNRFILGLVCFCILVVFVLYAMVSRLILRPMENLTRDIHKITSAGRLPINPGIFLEIQSLCASINDMLDKMAQSTMSTNVFRSIFNGLEAFLFVSAPETGQILFINNSMKKRYGLDDRAIGQPCWKVLQEGQSGICPFCPLEKLKQNNGEVIVWEEFNSLTGRYYENTSGLIEWNNHTYVHLQHSIDISNLKIAEQEIIAAKEMAEQSNAAKTNFLARMSHEMRTPLNAIIGMTTIASQHAHDPERVAYCLPKISEASAHLLGVITDILDMSKIESGKFELVNAEFDLAKMIRRVVEMMTFRIDEKQHKFDFSIDDAIPAIIVADEHRLSQVLANLLSNAIKFTPPEGCIALRVLQADCRGDTRILRFEISDNGIGITEEQRDKLFVLFEQGEGGFSRKHEGLGLGLSICKNIIEHMDGKIWVESQLGHGSTFIFEITVSGGGFEIPSGRRQEGRGRGLKTAALPPEVRASSAGGEEEDESIENIFLGRNLLLAEDVEINREITLAMLEDTAVKIDCAENGIEAVRMFRENPGKYQCILMDIHMPEMDGFEATRRIRAQEENRREANANKANLNIPAPGETPKDFHQVPIIAMTANVFREDVEKCLAVGMNDHLGKPIDLDELMKKLKLYMR
jgi:signal transduction histidine kinase/CheY-like chemotaxis protein